MQLFIKERENKYMNKKTLIGITIAILVIAVGGIIVTSKTGKNPVVSSTTTGNKKVYCGSDGKLTDTQSIQSHRSYCEQMTSNQAAYQPNTSSVYSFKIIDDQGNVVKDFDTVHEKLMHFIVVRKDLANFQHVHPEFNATTGEFTLSNLNFPSDGPYRLFADFTPSASQLAVTASEDLQVGNIANYQPQTIGNTANSKTFDGYQFTLTSNPVKPATGSENILTFDIKQDGKAIKDLEKYLGALGHSVILSEGDLQFIHAHPIEDPAKPQTGKVNFAVDFPEAGTYKVFTQFQRNGKVITTDFVVKVVEGSATGLPQSGSTTHGGAMMH
jgi:hypothetical protein